jgi:hypothetical protein
MKSTLPVVVVAVVVLAVVVSTYGLAQTQSRPPGVSAQDWVAISDTAGVVLGDPVARNSYQSAGGQSFAGMARFAGTLMVLRNDAWVVVQMAPDSTPRLQPLH